MSPDVKINQHINYWEREKATTYHAIIDGIGYVMVNVKDEDNHDFIISYLSVDTKHRGKGYGTLLLNHAEQICKADERCEVISLAVHENSWMHKWYLDNGYEYYAHDNHEPDIVWLEKQIK